MLMITAIIFLPKNAIASSLTYWQTVAKSLQSLLTATE